MSKSMAIEEIAQTLRLVREDQIRLAQALIDHPEPCERLRVAAKNHAELVASAASFLKA